MATVGLGLDSANLVGVIVQAFFFGIFQVLFAACIYVLVCRRTTDCINYRFLIAACLMWILIGLNFALSWSRVMDAFIDLQPVLQDDPNAISKYFWDLGHWKEVTRTGCYISLTFVADVLFIYRCYIVWGRSKYIIIIPLILLCGSISCGVTTEVLIRKSNVRGDAGRLTTVLFPWITAFFSISLVQNVLTTSFIVYRIWRVNLGMRHMTDKLSLWPVMAVLLESGAIYSTILIALLMAYISGSFAQYIALDMLVPIIGIVFNLIIVRIGLGLSRSPRVESFEASPIRFPLQKLNITVPRHITVECDPEHHCSQDDNMHSGSARGSEPDASDTLEQNSDIRVV